MQNPNDLIPYVQEQDITQPSRDWDKPQIEMGVVGWEDEDTYYEKGTADNDGMLLIRVQLYRGRNFTREIKPKVAQGHKILCVMSTIFGHRIPPKGTRCYVAIPFGFDNAHGTACIFALAEKNPTFQFDGNVESSDGVPRMMLGNDNVHVIVRGKSVTLTGPDDCFLQVGTGPAGGDPAIVMQDTEGAGAMISKGAVGIAAVDNGDATSYIQMSSDTIDIIQKSGCQLQLKGGDATLFGNNDYLFASGVYLGLLPTNATAVAYRSSGPGTVVVGGSTNVFVSP